MADTPHMMTTASLEPNQIAVTPIIRADDGSKWLQISIPNGWDDVKRICKRVLTFQGQTYTFMSWNSDTLLCHFKQNDCVATVGRKVRP